MNVLDTYEHYRCLEEEKTIVTTTPVLSQTPEPDDSMLLEEVMSLLEKVPCSVYNPNIDLTVRIVSSSDTSLKHIVPSLLESINQMYNYELDDIQAQITHVVPPHKTITYDNSFTSTGGEFINFNNDMHFTDGPIERTDFKNLFNGHLNSTEKIADDNNGMFSIVARSSYISTHRLRALHNKHLSASSTDLTESETQNSHSDLHSNSSSGSGKYLNPIKNTTSCSTLNSSVSASATSDYASHIYNNFVLVSNKADHSQPSVPPFSCHYALAIHSIPTHCLPSFESIINARFKELKKGGIMIYCYPSSRRLYDDHVLKCLDLALHQLLALNTISTQTCEEVSIPPPLSKIPSFEAQRQYLTGIPNVQILYTRKLEDSQLWDWGYWWLNEEIEWLRCALAKTELSSSEILLKLIGAMQIVRNGIKVESVTLECL